MDKEDFIAEIEKAGGGIAVIKRYNRLRHHIKIQMGKDPEFYRPLAQRLEELIEQRKAERISQLELIKGLDEIRDAVINKSKEARARGFSGEREYAVFKTINSKIPREETARDLTGRIVTAVAPELQITGWDKKAQVQKTIRKKIKDILTGRVGTEEKQQLAHVVLEILRENRE